MDERVIYISYFYKIRFFEKNMIPFSTATFNPKWYREHGCFLDKNGVVNGLRILDLIPNSSCQEHGVVCNTVECKHDANCEFLRRYYEQLKNIDFNSLIAKLYKFVDELSMHLNIDNPKIVLIVYEPPYKTCSERIMLIKWFKENGYELREF